jgi:hypothetical protein
MLIDKVAIAFNDGGLGFICFMALLFLSRCHTAIVVSMLFLWVGDFYICP